MNCEYARDYYDVPAEIGRRVVVFGKPGIIAEDRGHYIGVNLDCDKPGVVVNVHPRDAEYGEIGIIRKITRSQERYREWKRSESSLSFAEWIGAA